MSSHATHDDDPRRLLDESWSFTVTETGFGGDARSWTAKGKHTMEMAERAAFRVAIAQGWKPPRWWQWWRASDGRPSPAARAAVERALAMRARARGKGEGRRRRPNGRTE